MIGQCLHILGEEKTQQILHGALEAQNFTSAIFILVVLLQCLASEVMEKFCVEIQWLSFKKILEEGIGAEFASILV